MSDSTDEYLNNLYKAYDYNVTQFEKNILYISSGALGLSMTFIEKIVPLKTAILKDNLIMAYYLLAVTILLSLLASFCSFRHIAKFIKVFDRENPKKNEEYRAKFNRLLRALNFLMMLSLFSGIIFLIYFIQKNI